MNTEVTLERDGLDQPWGFRLQGGSDVGLPLAVLRVLVGSPADNVLKKGDLIMKIGSTNTQTMTHQKAVDVFECPGNKLILTVRRNGSGSSSAAPTIKASQIVPHLSSAADTLQSPQVAALPRTTFVPKDLLPPQPAAPKDGSCDHNLLQSQGVQTYKKGWALRLQRSWRQKFPIRWTACCVEAYTTEEDQKVRSQKAYLTIDVEGYAQEDSTERN